MPAPPKLFTNKVVPDLANLKKAADGLRATGRKIVVTIGSWDMLHIGHVRYLIKASSYGDILIVGTDSDLAVARYKGPHRPFVPQDERMEMLSYLDCVHFVTLVDDVTESGRWTYKLLRIVRPDVFVAVEDSYPESQKRAIVKLVGHLEVLPRQAEQTSSTFLFQKLIRTLPTLASVLDRR